MGTTTEKLTYLQGTKDAIKNAIEAKGVEVPEGTTFRGYAEKVGEIQTGMKIETITVSIERGSYEIPLPILTKDNTIRIERCNSGSTYKNVIKNVEVQIELTYEMRVEPEEAGEYIPEDEFGLERYKLLADCTLNYFY